MGFSDFLFFTCSRYDDTVYRNLVILPVWFWRKFYYCALWAYYSESTLFIALFSTVEIKIMESILMITASLVPLQPCFSGNLAVQHFELDNKRHMFKPL